jgi:hypothetical protein
MAPCPFCRRPVFLRDLQRDGAPAFPLQPGCVQNIAREEVVVSRNIWLPELIVLNHEPTIIRYEFMPLDRDAEVIGAFSSNCRNWDQGGCDALSWYAASHRADFSFRGEMFGTFPPDLAQSSRRKVSAGDWHTMEVQLSLSQASYKVDGVEFGKVLRHQNGTEMPLYPEEGHLGMIRWATQWKYRNVEVVFVPGAHPPIRPPPPSTHPPTYSSLHAHTHTQTLHPQPYALHPTPSTLHPAPSTLHPAPYTLHAPRYTPRPNHQTLNLLHPTPEPLNPKP